MAGINLLGHEENGNAKKREERTDFELTHPKRSSGLPDVTPDGAVKMVRDLLDSRRGIRRMDDTRSARKLPPRERPVAPPQPPPVPPPPPAPPAPPFPPSPQPSSPKHSFFHMRHDEGMPPGAGGGLSGLDVNLIPPADEDPFLIVKRARWLAVAALGSIIILLLVYAGLVIYESRLVNQGHTLDARLQEQQAVIQSFQRAEQHAEAIANRANALVKLLDQHPRWTNVFEILEENTLPTVYYGDLSATSAGQLTLTGYAPDYATVADQLRVLEAQDETFLSVSISRAENTSVSFEISNEDGTTTPVSVPKVVFGLELSLDPASIVDYSLE